MTKLLIADDELLVQIGIKSMLDWEAYGIEICGTAMNGSAALDMIAQYSPEIVLTDIRMPIMNGLELAKTCRNTYGQIPLFIFLTSYEEFQLIKEAMACEAVDYLIKLELDADALGAAMTKALSRLESLIMSDHYRRSGKPLLQNYYDKFMIRLLHNLFDTQEQFELQAKDIRLEFKDECYTVAFCEIREDLSSKMDHTQFMNLYNSTVQMTKDILTKHIPVHVVTLDIKNFALIFHTANLQTSTFNRLEEALSHTREMIHNYFNVTLKIGVGTPVSNPFKISESFQEARRAFRETKADKPCIFFAGDDPDSLKNLFNITMFKSSLTRAFEEFDTDVLYDTLSEIIQLFSSSPSCFLQAVDGACNILHLALSLLPDGEDTMEDIFSKNPDGYRSIYRFTEVTQVTDWLIQLRNGLCETLKSKRKTYKAHVITNVQKYIQNHLEERLTLNDVAGVFGLNPNYLSVLFKKSCGLGFSEYITQAKIGKAKSYLLEQDMKIYEVADQLGFESAFYFSKVFKKVEGISPREFQQQNTLLPDS